MSLVFLGIAYGLYEEIAVIRSIINQNWHELEGIGQYNFWGGINWTYGLMLVHFHIAVSIVSSVFIAEAIFHKRRNERWLSNPMLIITAIGLALWIPAGFYMSKGIQSAPLYILGILAIILFVYAAKAIPAQPFKKLGGKAAKPIHFYVLGTCEYDSYFPWYILRRAKACVTCDVYIACGCGYNKSGSGYAVVKKWLCMDRQA